MTKSYVEVRKDLAGWLRNNPKFEVVKDSPIEDFLEHEGGWYENVLCVCRCNLCDHYNQYCVLGLVSALLPSECDLWVMILYQGVLLQRS